MSEQTDPTSAEPGSILGGATEPATTAPTGTEPAAGVDQGNPAAGTVDPSAQAIVFPEDWKSSLSDDIRDDPSMKAINDIHGLAKSYVHAQRSIGADKIILPGKHAKLEDAEFRDIFTKLGLPDSVENYELTPKEGVEVDADFQAAYKDIAFKMGVLPQQAQAMSEWYDSFAAQRIEQQRIENATLVNEGISSLKTEWGDAFVSNIKIAQSVVDELGGQELRDKLTEAGLDNSPEMIKFMVKVGESFGEDKFRGDNTSTSGGVTPDEAARQIAAIQADPKSPYHDRSHPEHKYVVDEVTKLFQAKRAG